MFRLIQEAFTKLSFEEMSAMTHKATEETEKQALKAVKEEPDFRETIVKLKAQLLEQEKEMLDIKKLNKKLEKRNKNLKESIEKLIEEKRQIEELSKVIEMQKEKIEEYEKQVAEIKDLQRAVEEKIVPDKKSLAPQGNKYKNTDPQLLSKQVELLSSKNQELKAELDRRTRISDQMKREHEAALKDRNDLFSEVKCLKQQVDEMKQRLDRSLAQLVKKKKGIKELEESSIDAPSTITNESLPNSTKGTQTLRDKSAAKISTGNQNRKGAGGRLILNSVGKVFQKDTAKRNRFGTLRKSDTISKSSAQTSDMSKVNSTKVSKIENSQVEVSESIAEVKGKRVVSDIRNRLERRKREKDDVLNDDNTSSTDSKDMSPIQSSDTQDKAGNLMDLFEIIDEDDTSPRKL